MPDGVSKLNFGDAEWGGPVKQLSGGTWEVARLVGISWRDKSRLKLPLGPRQQTDGK